MKTIVAGSRSVTQYDLVATALERVDWEITEIVSGTARGVDTLGEVWANKHSTPIKRFPAAWKTLGKSAGYVRNTQMAEYADALVAIWDGESVGTAHMLDLAKKAGLKIVLWIAP